MALAEARAERSMERLQAMLGPDGGLVDAAFAGDAAASPARLLVIAPNVRRDVNRFLLSIASHATAVDAV